MAKTIKYSYTKSCQNAFEKAIQDATIGFIKELVKNRVNFETTSLEDALKLINFEVKTPKKTATKAKTKSKSSKDDNKGPHKRPRGRAKKDSRWCSWRNKWVDEDSPIYIPENEERKEQNEEQEEQEEQMQEEQMQEEQKKKKNRIIKKKKKPEHEPSDDDDDLAQESDDSEEIHNQSGNDQGIVSDEDDLGFDLNFDDDDDSF